MPLDWVHLQNEERAQAILDDIEGLDDSEVQELLREWKDLGIDPLDEQRSFSALTRLALDRLATKNGAPTSRERARTRLRRRGVIE